MCSSDLLEWCSVAGEVRPALLGKGPYRFLVVLGKIGLRLKAEAQVHHRMGKLTQRDVDGLLCPADRPHRAAGQSSGEPVNLLIELIGRHTWLISPMGSASAAVIRSPVNICSYHCRPNCDSLRVSAACRQSDGLTARIAQPTDSPGHPAGPISGELGMPQVACRCRHGHHRRQEGALRLAEKVRYQSGLASMELGINEIAPALGPLARHAAE